MRYDSLIPWVAANKMLIISILLVLTTAITNIIESLTLLVNVTASCMEPNTFWNQPHYHCWMRFVPTGHEFRSYSRTREQFGK
jgi:hypothetical protein